MPIEDADPDTDGLFKVLAELKKIVDLQNDDRYTKANNLDPSLKRTKRNLEEAAKKEGLQIRQS